MPSASPAVAAWHALVANPDATRLRSLLAPTVTFQSPAVHTPQEGPEKAFSYLWAALEVLGPSLTYLHEWTDDTSAVLLFSTVVDGLDVSGVDIIEWDDQDRITKFTVMARPFKGLQALINGMGAALGRTS